MKYSKETFIDVLRDAMDHDLINVNQFSTLTSSYLENKQKQIKENEQKINDCEFTLLEHIYDNNILEEMKEQSKELKRIFQDLMNKSTQLYSIQNGCQQYNSYSKIKDHVDNINTLYEDMIKTSGMIDMITKHIYYMG